MLDIGCGSLRGGRLAIPYLGVGNYFGIEPDRELVETGIEVELGRETCARKQPHFLFGGEFQFSEFDTTFDYLMAQSILSHTHVDMTRDLLRNARRVVHDESIFVGTFLATPRGRDRRAPGARHQGGAGLGGEGGVAYTWRDFRAPSPTPGSRSTRVRFPHPLQTWFVAVPDPAAARLGEFAKRAAGWDAMGEDLWNAQPLRARNRRVYLMQRRWEALQGRLRAHAPTGDPKRVS